VLGAADQHLYIGRQTQKAARPGDYYQNQTD
jgi:hypothetical protein